MIYFVTMIQKFRICLIFFFFTCSGLLTIQRFKKESLVSHIPVCDKEICSIQLKQTNKKLHIQMKYNFQNKYFSLRRVTPHTAYKASVELPSCWAYMSNGTASWHRISQVKQSCLTTATHMQIVLDIIWPKETKPSNRRCTWHRGRTLTHFSLWQEKWFPCTWVSVWGAGAEWKKTYKFIS